MMLYVVMYIDKEILTLPSLRINEIQVYFIIRFKCVLHYKYRRNYILLQHILGLSRNPFCGMD